MTGEVKSPAGETVQRVSGEWNASLDFTSVHVREGCLHISDLAHFADTVLYVKRSVAQLQ